MSEGLSFELRRAGLSYGKRGSALIDADLTVMAGERLALLGPSGAGKTTLLELLGARRLASSGEVHMDGQPMGNLSPQKLRALRARIGFVHQDHRLIPNLRVSHNVLAGRLGRESFPASLRRMLLPPRKDLEEVLGILDRVGIGDRIFERSDRLSGGERQRVAIARALYQMPGALLADEPVASVDPARARDAVALLTRLAEEDGLTLVLSLHNLELAREFFPRLIGLRKGRILFDGPASELSDEDFRELYSLEDATLGA